MEWQKWQPLDEQLLLRTLAGIRSCLIEDGERRIKRDGKEDVVFKLRVAPNPAM